MTRWLPSLPMAFSVFVFWLLLVGRVDAGQLLIAALLALTLPWVGQRLRLERANMRRPAVALRLALRVGIDIVLSNVQVARLILGREAKLHPDFVWIPLELTNPYGIAALAGIITLTPGTVSVDLAEDRRHLLVHFLNLHDPAAAVAQIKARYERPLKEIFP